MKKSIRSFADFQEQVVSDARLQDELKQDPVRALEQFRPVIATDKWIYRSVVVALGLAVLLIIGGVVGLMLKKEGLDDKSVPTLLTALGSAAIGALAGLLAPSPDSAS